MKFDAFLLRCFLVIIIPCSLIISQEKLCMTKLLNASTHSGERIFFTKKHDVIGFKIGDIYSMNPDGSDLQRLTALSDQFYVTELPALSRDGTKLTFISNFESWKSAFYTDVFLADLITGTFKRITGDERPFPPAKTTQVEVVVRDPFNYAISPSAIRISYKGCNNFVTNDSSIINVPADEDIWIKAEFAKGKGDIEYIRLQQSNEPQRVELFLTGGTISAESCDLSRDNSYLAVSVNSEDPTFQFYKIGIWGSNGVPFYMQDVGGHSLGGDIYPTFSPDGSKLAFCTGQHTLNSLGVISTSDYSVSPNILVEGSGFGIQAFCSQPSWSPEGLDIAFVYTTINGLEIQSNLYKVNVSNGSITQLTSYFGNEIVSRPSYSPDGKKIAFTHLISPNIIFSFTDLINGTFQSNINILTISDKTITSITSDGNSLDPSWGIVPGAVDVESENIPDEYKFELMQNYPNPFNPNTTIKYTIPLTHPLIPSREGNEQSDRGVSITLKIYDILGREIATLVDEAKVAGDYEIMFDGSNLSNGVYYYVMRSGTFVQIRKMILMK